MPGWLEKLLAQITEEWKVIRGAPITLVTLLAVAAGVIWTGLSFHFSGVIEAQRATIQTNEATIKGLEARQKALTDAPQKLAESEKEVQSLRSEVAGLTARLASRHLTSEQKAQLLGGAKSLGPLSVALYSDSGPEIERYASEFQSAFEAGGWKVARVTIMDNTINNGLWLVTKPDDPKAASYLALFGKAGVEITPGVANDKETMGYVHGSDLAVLVGDKPEPP